MSAEQIHFQDGLLWIPALGKNLIWRRMCESDLGQILELENRLFVSPWPRQLFHEELQEKDHVLATVLEEQGRIAVYLIAYFISDEVHIANIGTAPEFQRRGLGLTLMQTLLRRAKENGFCLVHLEVRKNNHAAISLYQKIGFEIVGLRKNYYEQEKEDALLMTKVLQDGDNPEN